MNFTCNMALVILNLDCHPDALHRTASRAISAVGRAASYCTAWLEVSAKPPSSTTNSCDRTSRNHCATVLALVCRVTSDEGQIDAGI